MGAAKKKPAAKADAVKTYDLDQLAHENPRPRDGFRELIVAARAESDLIDDGRAFDSDDIVSAVPGVAGSALEQWRASNDATRQRLVGLSEELIGLLIHETLTLRAMSRDFDARSSGSDVGSRRRALKQAMSAGIDMRDSFSRTLGNVLPAGSSESATLESAQVAASTPAVLAGSLTSLSALVKRARELAGRENLGSLEKLGLTVASSERLAAAAEDLLVRDNAAAAASPESRITQRQLDLQDGIVLHLIASVWRAFRDAGAQDPKIVQPPLGRVKRLLVRTAPKAKTQPPSA